MRCVLILHLIFVLTSCSKDFLGDEPSSDPVDVFETLWKEMDQHYAVFQERGVDWDSLYAVYRPQISASTTQEELWQFIGEMLSELDDCHTCIYGQNGRSINSGWLRQLNGDRYFGRPIIDDYLQSPSETVSNRMFWGKIKDRNIGYIYPEGFGEYNIEDLDLLVEKVKRYGAVIVDNRNNRGGTAAYAWRLSSWFSDNTDNVVYTQFRNGPSHNNFSSKREHRNHIRENNLSNIPVIVLTNRGTVSAAEWFLLSMKTFKNVVQIGDTSVGAYSTISPRCFLPNGWTYYYSIHKVLLPDGTSPEGKGSAPDIYVINTHETIHDECRDVVLERALEYLQENFGL